MTQFEQDNKNNTTYHTMKLAAFVALRLTSAVLGLPSAELTEVFSCLGYNIFVQFHLYPPQLFSFSLCQYLMRTAGTSFREQRQRDQD